MFLLDTESRTFVTRISCQYFSSLIFVWIPYFGELIIRDEVKRSLQCHGPTIWKHTFYCSVHTFVEDEKLDIVSLRCDVASYALSCEKDRLVRSSEKKAASSWFPGRSSSVVARIL